VQVDYQPFIDRMINRYEGGYVWNKNDPGGPTKYGVTCYDLAQHRGQSMTSMADWAAAVKAMPLSEAEDIYRAKYAKAIVFDALPAGIDCCMMDYGVNSGTSRPVRVASALFKMPVHHVVTPDLLDAIKKCDPIWFINSMCEERLHFMHQIRGGSAWTEFGAGWQSRVDNLDAYCVGLAQKVSAPVQAPDLSKVPTAKAIHPPAPASGTVTATVTASGGVAAAAHTVGIQPWEITLAVMAVVAAGVAVHEWRQNKVVAANAEVVLPPGVIAKAV
jgi:lysozyme family protein